MRDSGGEHGGGGRAGRVLVVVVVATAAGVAAATLLGSRPGVRAPQAPTTGAGPAVELPPTWQRGANLTAYEPNAYGSGAAATKLERLRALGVDHVALVPLWYMDSATSSAVRPDPARTATSTGLGQAIAAAHRLGISVALAPHVEVDDGSFRGRIAPADREAWFRSYRRLVAAYAGLAAAAGADELVVGTELTSMSADERAWRKLIALARRRFDGVLTYAANWVDEAEEIRFWDALDELGINAYMPLVTPSPTPTTKALGRAWRPYVRRIRALAGRWRKPVVFTELGYQSRAGAPAAGGRPATGPISEQVQANAYEAAYRSFADRRWFRGIWWWDWSVAGGEPAGGFTPEGKLAERVVAAYNRAAKRGG